MTRLLLDYSTCLKLLFIADLWLPQLLDTDRGLHFSLLRLQLVELIRASFTSPSNSNPTAIADAIAFAQENLAPYATLDNQFKHDLERAMALLIVPRESWNTSAASLPTSGSGSGSNNDFGTLSELVDPSLRKRVAKDVNEALLQVQGKRREANIRYLVRARAWAEQLAREKKIDLPPRLNLGLDGDEVPADGNGHNGDTEMAENGNEEAAAEPATRSTRPQT